MIYVGHSTALNIVVVVGNSTTVDVVVGVDTGTVDCAGTGTSIIGSTSVVCGHIAHTVAGTVGVNQAGASVPASHSRLLIDQRLR